MKFLRFSVWAAASVVSVALLSGCSAKEAVSVSGSIANVGVKVEKGTLANRLSGSFDVSVSLGQRASDSTEVLFSSFSIVSASGGTAVLSSGHVSVRTTTPLPVTLQPGDTKTVPFLIGDEKSGQIVPIEISEDDLGALCANPVRIIAEMTDSATGGQGMSIRSEPFTPEGCP